MSEFPKFLTIKEFAAANKFSVDMIEHRCQDNTIPHVRVGRSIRIPENALVILMAEQGWTWTTSGSKATEDHKRRKAESRAQDRR